MEPLSDKDDEAISKEERDQVTTEMVDKWSNQLQKNQPTLNTIRYVIRAFGFAVQSAYGGGDVSVDTDSKKKKKKQITSGAIDDPESFNAIVRVCLKQLLSANEQEHRLVYNKDVQPIEVINPFVRWHRRWYRSKAVDPSPTVGVFYTPFNMALAPWAMGLGDMGCAKIFKQYRMCTHMMPSTHRHLCEDEKADVKECLLAEKRVLRHHYMYQHRVKKNLPFPEDPLVDGYNWHSFKYLN